MRRLGFLLLLPLIVGTAHADPPAARPSASEPEAEHAEPIASYKLEARLDPSKHEVHGEGTITFKNASTKELHELWLHLYLNAFKNQGSVFMRAPVGGFRGASVPADWGTIDLKKLAVGADDLLPAVEHRRPGDDDETDARVPLIHPIAPGASITIDVEWNDKLPTIVERTGYYGSFHMVAQWFPKIAKLEPDGTFAHFPFHHLGEFYADYGTYDVTLDVPEGFTVGACGPITETKNAAGRHVERHVQSDIHDFAWTAWDKFQKRTEKIEGVDVTVLTPPGYDDSAERELETMRFALPHYNARYGRYPYGVLTLVHPPAMAPEAGGMEYPTLITTGYPSWIPRGIHLVEGVTIHEYGHQYFYGLLGSNEDSWPFLDEGLNSYAELEGMTAWKGAGSGVDFAGIRVGEAEWQANRARHFDHDQKVAQASAAFDTGAAYASLVYSRTATILATLARVYGKETMDHALGVYARRFKFHHPTPDDFLRTMTAELGPDAGENLRLALFEKGWVDYAITQVSSHPTRRIAGLFDHDGKREKVKNDVPDPKRFEGFVLVVRRGTLRFPVEVELVSVDGTKTRVPWDGQAESMRVPFAGSSPLRSATVDPDERILLDNDRTNDFVTAGSQSPAGAPRTFERALFWAGALLGGLGP